MQFLIFGNTFDHSKAACMASLIEALERHGIDYALEREFFNFINTATQLKLGDNHLMRGDEGADCIAMSIGGDGTFLRTARIAAQRHIPIIGVNMGRMGFLTDIEPSTMDKSIECLAKHQYHIEERNQLSLTVDKGNGTTHCTALNEIAVMKMDISAMLTIKASVNGQFLSNYQCDGLIVATSTGSTAYSLSVGGPIIMPQSKSIVLTPVAPHNLSIRPIVMCDDWTVEMEVRSRNRQFLVSVDGANMACDESDRLTVTKAPEAVMVVKLDCHPMFENLRSKLMLGVDGRDLRQDTACKS